MSSIESFRVLAIFAAVLWHAGLASDLLKLAEGNFPLALTGYLVWWVGVPYFLITAGYFFRQSVLAEGNPVAQLRRYVFPLMGMFLGWMCLYIVIPDSWPVAVVHRGLWQPFYTEAVKNIHLLMTEHLSLFLGARRPIWHLWFLPALMFSLGTLTLMTVWRLERYLVPLIISLYGLALAEEIVGGHFFNSTIEVGLWATATLITAIGWWLADRREQLSVAMAYSLMIGGYAMAFLEGMVMEAVFHSSQQAIQEHLFLGGIFLSLGIFTLAIAKPHLGQSTPFPFLAQFTLGVYLSHIFVLYTLHPIIGKLRDGIPWPWVFVAILVYIVSVLLTFVLTKIPPLKFLVVKPARRNQHRVTEGTRPTNKTSSSPSGQLIQQDTA